MRNCLALLLVMSLMLGALPACAEEVMLATAQPASKGVDSGTVLTVGTLTPLNGHFATDMWGNNTADMDVRALLHGYETVSWTSERGLVVNEQVVASLRVETVGDGLIYTIELAQDLYYCDGTQITAADYVFGLLLGGASEITALGGTPSTLNHVQGYEAYLAGQTNVLSGLRLLSEYSYSIHVISAYLPYFYGLAMAGARPLPVPVIAPGCAVLDDGQGVYIGAGQDAAALDATGLGYTPGEFSVEMLESTMMDPDTGYLSHPMVTCGPYRLEAYQRGTNTVTVAANTYFKGTHQGYQPRIERIVFRTVKEQTMLADLQAVRLDLINKIADPGTMATVSAHIEQGAAIDEISYMRTGFAYLSFACDRFPTSSVAVRQAVARAFDKDALVEGILPGSALRVYGYYGLGQWMATYQDEGDLSEGLVPLSVMDSLESLDVPMDLREAQALLEMERWTLNADGMPYTDGDGMRYRETDGVLEPLLLRMAITENDIVSQQVSGALQDALPALGIGLEVTSMPFTELLTYFYRQEASDFNCFFLASNFTYIFDPYYDFNISEAYQGLINPTGLRDYGLMEQARKMRDTPPMELRTYVEHWLDFQQRFVELMPMVPLYSNVYHDVFTDDLKGYDISGSASWALSILRAHLDRS